VTKVSKEIKVLPVKEIWPKRIGDWENEVLAGYLDILELGEGKDYSKLPIWEYFVREHKGDMKAVQKQFRILWPCYHSIKKKGYQLIRNDMVEVVDVRDMPHTEYDNRMGDKWYRLSGEHRLAVCYFMEIYRIPTKVFKVRIEAW